MYNPKADKKKWIEKLSIFLMCPWHTSIHYLWLQKVAWMGLFQHKYWIKISVWINMLKKYLKIVKSRHLGPNKLYHLLGKNMFFFLNKDKIKGKKWLKLHLVLLNSELICTIKSSPIGLMASASKVAAWNHIILHIFTLYQSSFQKK